MAHRSQLPPERRPVVTGIGVVSCLGLDRETFWRRLCAGESGIKPITKFDPVGLRNEEAGEIDEFDIADYIVSDLPPMDEASHFALAATSESLDDAGLAEGDAFRRDASIVYSTNFGGAASWELFVEDYLEGAPNPDDFQEFLFHSAARHAARMFGLGGRRFTLSNSCSSGASAIGVAADLIRSGRSQVAIAGGHDTLGISILAGLSILRTITADAIRPFDKNRSGTIFGEGAAVLVLESLAQARNRDATIYGEVLGYHINNNAYHLTAPDKDGAGMVEVLQAALADAGTDAAEVDYINAHATGTQYHDRAETAAIKTVLGGRAAEIPVSSIKGGVGHMMAGAGTIECAACLLAMRDGVIPPTINYETPDPECDLDCVPNRSRQHAVETAVSISAGIGGNNSAVILRIAP